MVTLNVINKEQRFFDSCIHGFCTEVFLPQHSLGKTGAMEENVTEMKKERKEMIGEQESNRDDMSSMHTYTVVPPSWAHSHF